MKCEMCGKDLIKLGNHLKEHNLTVKQYYDSYVKNKNEGECLICGKDTSFISLISGYREYCSRKCMSNSQYILSKKETTCFKKYGVKNPFQSETVKEKIKETTKLKYGVENISQNKEIQKKKEITTFKNYGVYHPIQNPDILSKIVNTCKDRYGEDNYFKTEKFKQQFKSIMLEKYGVDSPLKVEEFHQKGIKAANSREARIRAANTMRGNDNNSTWEDCFEEQLKNINIKYEKNYDKDPRYPFQCDFYLIDTDTFIEINGYWSHGGHWFDENNLEDIQILNTWKEKADQGHKQYKNAIQVWTVKDKLKLQYAKENNLKYIVLWSMDDIKLFFKNLKFLFTD